MQLSKIKKILKENQKYFEALERYDQTRELPFKRKKIYLTLSVEILNKLKELRAKTGRPISRLVEERIRLT